MQAVERTERAPETVKFRAHLRNIWNAIDDDNITGLAAQMSYYFVLALFPFLIVVAALVGMLPFTGSWNKVLTWITLYFPRDSQSVIFDTVAALTKGRKSFLSFGLVGTAWAASGGLMSLMAALNVVYDVKETRGYLRRLSFAIGMIVVLALLLLSSFGLLSVGDRLDHWLSAHTPSPSQVFELWSLARWIISVALTGIAIALLYQTMPNLRRRWRWARPGTGFFVLGWVLATAGFNAYIRHLATYNKTYGVLGAFIVLMVWIYLASLLILIGAEIDSELHKTRAGAVPRPEAIAPAGPPPGS